MEARANHISLCTYIIISESEKLTKKLIEETLSRETKEVN